MIYSSADILRALGSDVIIRQTARLSIVDGKPGYEADEYIYIYIDKYPTINEFEATWKVWVVDATDGENLDLVLSAISAILPNFNFENGYYTVTDLASDKTVVKTEVEKQLEQTQAERAQLKKDFAGVSQSLQAKANALKNGRDGKDGVDGRDGRDGKDGADGRDGKDLIATEAELFDLQNVEQGIQMERGQVLTWDGSKWTNLYVRQTMSAGGPVGSTTTITEGVPAIGQSIAWKYHHEGGDHEPHSGDFHADNQQTDLTTQFHVSNFNSSHTDVSLLLQELLVTTKRLYISETGDGAIAHLFNLVSYAPTAEGYELNVSHVETPGPEVDFTDNRIYNFLFLGAAATVPEVLDDLDDVNAATPQVGQALVWNGVAWVPQTISGTGGGGGGSGTCYGINDGGNVDTGLAQEPDCGSSCSGIGDGGDVDTGLAYAPDCGTSCSGIIDGGDVDSGVARHPNCGGNIEDAPVDGSYYVRKDGLWVDLSIALADLGVTP